MSGKIDVDFIVFDLDGTLADSLPDIAEAANYAGSLLGLPARSREAIQGMIGGGEAYLIERLVGPDHQAEVDRALELYLDYYTRHCGDLTRIYPEVAETLGRLTHKKLAVLSNKLQRLTEQTLEAVGLARFFMAVRGGGQNLPLKPSPEALRGLIRKLAVEPGRTLMVGDKPGDIATGKGSGAATVAVTYGYGTLEALREANPDVLIHHFSQLLDIVG